LNVTFAHTTSNDADTLVQIRIDAMRESLERIGRFDPVRARDRFLASFDARYCRYILVDGEKAGFVLVRPESAHLLLDHLYIVPAHQGKGVGAAVLDAVLADADALALVRWDSRSACRSRWGRCARAPRIVSTSATASLKLPRASGICITFASRDRWRRSRSDA
jgi:GNAT superfamily N-acetyltransferase